MSLLVAEPEILVDELSQPAPWMLARRRAEAREPHHVRDMALALDRAWEGLPDGVDRSDGTRKWLAATILHHFLSGEAAPDRLGELALIELSSSRQEFPSLNLS